MTKAISNRDMCLIKSNVTIVRTRAIITKFCVAWNNLPLPILLGLTLTLYLLLLVQMEYYGILPRVYDISDFCSLSVSTLQKLKLHTRKGSRKKISFLMPRPLRPSPPPLEVSGHIILE